MRRRLERHPNGHLYVRFRVNGVTDRFDCGLNARDAAAKRDEYERKFAAGTLPLRGLAKSSAPAPAQDSPPQPSPTTPAAAASGTTKVKLADGRLDIRLEELVVRHLDWVASKRSQATLALRKRYALSFLAHVGPRSVLSITTDDIEGYRQSLQSSSKGRQTGDYALRLVKTLLKWGVRNDHCDMPVRNFPEISCRRRAIARFTDENLRALLAKCPEDVGDLVRFAVLTGLRPRELRELRFDQVHEAPDCPYIRIDEHKTSDSRKVYQARSVPLGEQAMEIYRRRRGASRGPLVFEAGDGKPYTHSALRIRLERWCRRAKVPIRSPYALRHFYGLKQSAANTPLQVIKDSMGHSNIQTTCIYACNKDEPHVKAAQAAEDSLMAIIAPKPAVAAPTSAAAI